MHVSGFEIHTYCIHLNMERCICRFAKWQIHLFISKGFNTRSNAVPTLYQRRALLCRLVMVYFQTFYLIDLAAEPIRYNRRPIALDAQPNTFPGQSVTDLIRNCSLTVKSRLSRWTIILHWQGIINHIWIPLLIWLLTLPAWRPISDV